MRRTVAGMTAPPYDPDRCSLHFLGEILGVHEDDLRAVAARFGYGVVDGHLAPENAADVREWLNDAGGRSTPEWHGLAALGWREDDSPLHS